MACWGQFLYYPRPILNRHVDAFLQFEYLTTPKLKRNVSERLIALLIFTFYLFYLPQKEKIALLEKSKPNL